MGKIFPATYYFSSLTPYQLDQEKKLFEISLMYFDLVIMQCFKSLQDH